MQNFCHRKHSKLVAYPGNFLSYATVVRSTNDTVSSTVRETRSKDHPIHQAIIFNQFSFVRENT